MHVIPVGCELSRTTCAIVKYYLSRPDFTVGVFTFLPAVPRRKRTNLKIQRTERSRNEPPEVKRYPTAREELGVSGSLKNRITFCQKLSRHIVIFLLSIRHTYLRNKYDDCYAADVFKNIYVSLAIQQGITSQGIIVILRKNIDERVPGSS